MDAENRSDQQKNFDRWLDSALHARVDTEPRMGLEERVLARLASEPHRRFVWWPAMATAIAAVVVIAIALALLHPTQPEHEIVHGTAQPANASAANRASLQASSPTKIPDVPKHRNSQLLRGKNAPCCDSNHVAADGKTEERLLPKLASFPAPHPETQQERLLAQLANQLAAKREFSEIARLSIDSPPKDLSIQELDIEPLETTSGSSSPQE